MSKENPTYGEAVQAVEDDNTRLYNLVGELEAKLRESEGLAEMHCNMRLKAEKEAKEERETCAAIAERVCRENACPSAGYAAARAIRTR